MGAGGGQLSNLIKDVMTLRAQGFMPSNGNKMAIQEALEKRPNQTPLVEALKQTVNFQLHAEVAPGLGGRPPVRGSTPVSTSFRRECRQPPPTNPGVLLAPSGGVTQPIG